MLLTLQCSICGKHFKQQGLKSHEVNCKRRNEEEKAATAYHRELEIAEKKGAFVFFCPLLTDELIMIARRVAHQHHRVQRANDHERNTLEFSEPGPSTRTQRFSTGENSINDPPFIDATQSK